LLLLDGQVHHDTHAVPMGNYVIGVGNYMIATPSELGNYKIADRFGKVTVKEEIRSSKRGGLMPAVSSESSMERMPEPRCSQTVRVSPGSGTSSSSLMRVALRAEEIPSSPRLSMVTGPNSPPGFLMTSRSGVHFDLDLRASRAAG
jgi:hypothetical protein